MAVRFFVAVALGSIVGTAAAEPDSGAAPPAEPDAGAGPPARAWTTGTIAPLAPQGIARLAATVERCGRKAQRAGRSLYGDVTVLRPPGGAKADTVIVGRAVTHADDARCLLSGLRKVAPDDSFLGVTFDLRRGAARVPADVGPTAEDPRGVADFLLADPYPAVCRAALLQSHRGRQTEVLATFMVAASGAPTLLDARLGGDTVKSPSTACLEAAWAARTAPLSLQGQRIWHRSVVRRAKTSRAHREVKAE